MSGPERRDDWALRRAEQRLQLLIESVSDYAIFMLEPDGTIATWNLGAQRIKGYSAEEVIGRHFEIFYTAEDRASGHPRHELEEALREGRYAETGTRVRKDGSLFVADVVITALWDNEATHVGFAKVTRDVTERQRLIEERERLGLERMEFLAFAAHELRTPVAVIAGSASMLDQYWTSLSDADRSDLTATLVRGADRLRRLVEDLLLAAGLDAGGLAMSPEDVEVATLVRAVVSQHLTTAPDARFVIDCPDHVVARADPGRLEQMVGNYVANALRHGAPPVTISCRQDRDWVDITVADAGEGVAADTLPKLFEKFARGTHADSTGLGLFLVRAMARAQDGDAWYDDSDGPSFILRLPVGNAGPG